MQVYRIGPRFNASVLRLDGRRGSVDSGLAQVIRVGGTAGRPRVVRVGQGGYDDELQRTYQPYGPQVPYIQLILEL